MTRFPGSGLLKRIEAPEWYSSVRPEVGGIAEHVEQLLARLAVEARVVGQLLENDDEAGLLASLVDEVGHAVVQRVEVLAEVRRKGERSGNAFEHVLLGQRTRQVGVEEMLAGVAGGLHQILDAVGANRLDDIGADGLQ